MSILNETPVKTTEAQKKADRLRFLTRSLITEVYRSWNEIHDTIWKSPNPQEILNELKSDAAEILDINEETMQFLSSVLQGRKQSQVDSIISKIASTPETKTDEDGNVTII